jgi:hypothetical protein
LAARQNGEVLPERFHRKDLMNWHLVREKMKTVNSRLIIALCLYAILALVAVFALDGYLRTFVVLLMAFFAMKSIVHAKKGDVD